MIFGVPRRVTSLALCKSLGGKSFIYVARDDVRMTAMGDGLRGYRPTCTFLNFQHGIVCRLIGYHRRRARRTPD